LQRFLFDLAGACAEILLVHDGMIPHFMRAGIPRRQLRVLRNPVQPWRSSRVPAEVNRGVFFVGRVEADKGVDLLALSRDATRVREISTRAFTGARLLAPTLEQWCDSLLQICESKRAIARPRRLTDAGQVLGADAAPENGSWRAGKTGTVMGTSDGRS